MMECSAYHDIRDNFRSYIYNDYIYNDSQGYMRKVMCHAKQQLLAKLVH
jgi:hypothetical protein